MRTWTVASAASAPVALIGGWSVAQSQQPPGYDQISRTISALAARGATDRWIMTAGLVLLGACHLVTAAGLTDAGRWGRAFLALGGAATLAVASLPQPATGHVEAAGIGFVALAIWPAFALVPERAIRVAATAILLALLVWFALQLGGGAQLGLTERILAGAEALWPLAVALRLRFISRTSADSDS